MKWDTNMHRQDSGKNGLMLYAIGGYDWNWTLK